MNALGPASIHADALGRITTPGAQVFLEIMIADGRLPIQLHFVLEDGSELHLPITIGALEKLYSHLRRFSDAHDPPWATD